MSVTFAKGFSAAGVAAGISSVEGKKDLALVVNQGPLDSAAGVFTFNRFCAAPVQWSRKTVADGHIKAVILNSGGANACTGQAGYEQSAATAKKVAELVGTQPDEIAVCSTGLIGELLPLDHVLSGVESAYAALSDDDQAGSDASHAIMTTDTKLKEIAAEYNVTLTDDQMTQLVNLCRSLEKLDTNALLSKVQAVQDTLKQLAGAKDKVASFTGKVKDVITAIGDFFDRVISLFRK